MENFSVLLALCEWKPLMTDGFPSKWPVTRSFGVFLWSAPEQTVEQTIEMPVFCDPSRSLWRHCNDTLKYFCLFGRMTVTKLYEKLANYLLNPDWIDFIIYRIWIVLIGNIRSTLLLSQVHFVRNTQLISLIHNNVIKCHTISHLSVGFTCISLRSFCKPDMHAKTSWHFMDALAAYAPYDEQNEPGWHNEASTRWKTQCCRRSFYPNMKSFITTNGAS